MTLCRNVALTILAVGAAMGAACSSAPPPGPNPFAVPTASIMETRAFASLSPKQDGKRVMQCDVDLWGFQRGCRFLERSWMSSEGWKEALFLREEGRKVEPGEVNVGVMDTPSLMRGFWAVKGVSCRPGGHPSQLRIGVHHVQLFNRGGAAHLVERRGSREAEIQIIDLSDNEMRQLPPVHFKLSDDGLYLTQRIDGGGEIIRQRCDDF